MSFLAVVIGDSLGMPRCQAGIEIDDAYLYLLKIWWQKQYRQVIVWPILRRAASLQDLMAEFQGNFLHYIGNRKIDVCIVHLGIVDCAPRPLPFRMRSVVSHLPLWVLKRVTNFLHQNRRNLSKVGLSFHLASPDKFYRLYSNFINLLNSHCERVYCINMSPGLKETYYHSPGLKEDIIKYNGIIERAISGKDSVKLIDAFGKFIQDPEYYVTDDLHITREAHKWIYEQIAKYEENAR